MKWELRKTKADIKTEPKVNSVFKKSENKSAILGVVNEHPH